MVPLDMLGGRLATEPGDKYVGELEPYRSAGSGRVLPLPGWNNYTLEKLRGVAKLGFETNDRAEQATKRAESTDERSSRAMGSASPQGKAGHRPDDTPVTARPGFYQPVKMGFLLTIDLEVLYALLGV